MVQPIKFGCGRGQDEAGGGVRGAGLDRPPETEIGEWKKSEREYENETRKKIKKKKSPFLKIKIRIKI